jgi:hypothetical protein
VADLGQARACDKADIAGADDADIMAFHKEERILS